MKKAKASKSVAPSIKVLGTLTELFEHTRQRLQIQIATPRGPAKILAEPLCARDAERVQDIMDSVPPPTRKDEKGAEVVDIGNPDYLKAKREAERTARAVAVYLAVPMFREGIPADFAGTDEAIRQWVSDRATDTALAQLWTSIQSDFITTAMVEDAASGFTGPA